MKEQIMVSVFCTAYNHEKYIQKALDGFVMQKCNFKFEVFVHDDASTDNTAQIIREYGEKYPEIIIPILQTENKYSKGVEIWADILLPRARGKYIAYCEGDDCWIEENKLEKQVEYLESHPTCTFCATNGFIHNVNEDTYDDFVLSMSRLSELKKNEFDLDVGELTRFYIPTASFVFPRDNYAKFPPSYYRYCFGGDKKLAMYSCALGYCHFFNDKTCIYNKGVANSATTREKNIEEQTKIINGYLTLYNDLNSFTNYEYKEIFQPVIYEFEIMLLLLCPEQYKRKSYFKSVYKQLSVKEKIFFYIKKNQILYRFLKKIRSFLSIG